MASDEDRTIEDVVKDYASLQKSIDQVLKIKMADCKPDPADPNTTRCSVKDICSMKGIYTDGPILYQNAQGEKILNESYYSDRKMITACFKEQYADDIKAERDDYNTKLGNQHLKVILTLNKKLNELTTKYNQAAKIQKISSEILTISLEAGLKGDASNWDKKNATRADLATVIAQAEKRTKTTLNPDVKKYLLEIQFQKMNPAYEEELKRFEANLIPDYSNKNPFYDWSMLTDEKAAGGKKALDDNRAKLTQKAQDAYAIFQETQQDLLAYFDSKKNETNVDKIERIKERIKTIRFNPPRLTKELKDNCPNANAFYSAEDHSFTICPQMLEFPKMAIVETMAHEISHSYDSCSFSGKMYHTRMPPAVVEAPFEVNLKMQPILGSYSNTFYEDPEEMKIKDRMQDKMLYKDHPFSQTLSCLQDPKSVHAQAMNVADIKQKTKDALDELTRLGQNTPNNGKARQLNFLNDHQDFLDYFQGCDYSAAGSVLGKTQLMEAFADKIASEIVGKKLKALSKADAEKALLEISLPYDVCSNQDEGAAKLHNFAVKEGCSNYFENKTIEEKIVAGLSSVKSTFDPHPEGATRIERNILAQPDIRAALKCPADPGVKYCE